MEKKQQCNRKYCMDKFSNRIECLHSLTHHDNRPIWCKKFRSLSFTRWKLYAIPNSLNIINFLKWLSYVHPYFVFAVLYIDIFFKCLYRLNEDLSISLLSHFFSFATFYFVCCIAVERETKANAKFVILFSEWTTNANVTVALKAHMLENWWLQIRTNKSGIACDFHARMLVVVR